MQWNWSIENRVLAGFVLVFAILLVIGGVAYNNTHLSVHNSEIDGKSRELLKYLELTTVAVENADWGYRRFLVTGENSYLAAFEKAQEQTPAYLKLMQDLLSYSSKKREQLSLLHHHIHALLQSGQEGIRLRQHTNFQGIQHLLEFTDRNQSIEALRSLVKDIEREERQGLKERAFESMAGTRTTIVLLAIGTILQFVLLSAVYYLIHHDIQERRRVAGELLQRGQQLEAANQELEAFSYSVSHDLRAPLRHIDGYASLLEKNVGSSLTEKGQRYLETISESAKQMGCLIDDLLVFSRMGRSELAQTPINMEQLVKEVLHSLRHDIKDRDISWTIGPLAMVQADPAMLKQVLVNLISNAIKFTNSRSLAQIEIGNVTESSEEVITFVRDNGVGFDMNYAGKLFGVFQRLHRVEEFEGTGIGLANVRRIIHRHGGRTWAESQPGQGATFFFSLPIHRDVS